MVKRKGEQPKQLRLPVTLNWKGQSYIIELWYLAVIELRNKETGEKKIVERKTWKERSDLRLIDDFQEVEHLLEQNGFRPDDVD